MTIATKVEDLQAWTLPVIDCVTFNPFWLHETLDTIYAAMPDDIQKVRFAAFADIVKAIDLPHNNSAVPQYAVNVYNLLNSPKAALFDPQELLSASSNIVFAAKATCRVLGAAILAHGTEDHPIVFSSTEPTTDNLVAGN